MRTFRIPLRAVFYRENDVWFAHSLDMDLIGEGANKEEALQQLSEAICLQIGFSIENHNMRNIFQPADAKFHEMFAAGRDIAVGELQGKIELPNVQKTGVEVTGLEAREYVFDASDEKDCAFA